MSRYAILEHNHPTLHWDLLLEAGDVLKAWRLERPPDGNESTIGATEIADHRVGYLDYEGPVSGERGFVKRWDRGLYSEDGDSTADVRHLRFDGERLKAHVKLARVQNAEWTWQLVTAPC